jgi:hypothetical protein
MQGSYRLRNIFDQYSQHENRLTHALVIAFDEDSKLLRKFVKWITGTTSPKRLKIVEQQLPGEYELPEQESEQRGLPDAWIHDDDEWSLLIESKVQAKLNFNQLERHYRTARKRGFSNVTVLAIDVEKPDKKLASYVVFRSWREIYSWLSQQSANSEWALRTLRYMEVAERKWPAEGYMREGTLTEFSGIHFDENDPYNYGEAKRLIRLMMDELRQHSCLKSMIKPKASGRGAITGKSRGGVWDYLRLKGFNSKALHTNYPHLSMSIGKEVVRVFLIVPSSAEPRFRRAIIGLGEEGFFEVMGNVNNKMRKVLRYASGSSPYVSVNQRHFLSRSGTAIVDGVMNFDLRTAYGVGERNQMVKQQTQWLSAVFSLLANKKSNMDFGVGISFPYESCKKIQSPAILDSIAATWVACQPLLNVMPKR